MKKLTFLLISIYLFLLVISVFGHSGRTDKFGGHKNRKTGTYHYHN